jgi:hypothetical protein
METPLSTIESKPRGLPDCWSIWTQVGRGGVWLEGVFCSAGAVTQAPCMLDKHPATGLCPQPEEMFSGGLKEPEEGSA